MNEENVVVDNSNTTENEELNSTENTEETAEETKEENVEEIRSRLTKAEELANNYKIRAEKAEKKAKETVQTESKAEGELSSKDIIAINRANIHEDDLDEVIDYAKYKKISITEALKSGVIKTLLKDRTEQRKTAEATNTGVSKRGSVKVSDEDIVENVASGEVPEDPARLAQARWNLKKKK